MTLLSVVGRAGAAAGVAAGLGALGVAAQRHAVRRIMGRPDSESGEDFAGLVGTPCTVVAGDGTPLHVEVHEPAASSPDDVTIVFSHAFAMSQLEWYYQRRDLRDLGRLVLWDLRGHGRSDVGPVGSYTIDQLADDLRHVLDAVVPDGPVVLVGHSMGGMATLRLAASAPELFGERVQGVVLVCTSADERGRGLPLLPVPSAVRRLAPDLAGRVSRHPELLGRALDLGDDLVLVLTQRYGFGSDEVSPSLVDLTRDMQLATPVDVLGAFLPTFETYDATVGLDALRGVVTTVMTGTHDAIIPAERSHELANAVPGAELVVVEGAGHMLQLERYAEVNHAVRDVVARVRGPVRS